MIGKIQSHFASKPQRATFSVRVVLHAVIVSLVYLLVARASLFLVHAPQGIASVWPASGFALAILQLSRPRSWLWLLPGFFLANVCANLLGSIPVGLNLADALINLGEVALIAALLKRFLGASLTFTSLGQVLGFFFLIALGNAITALFGAALQSHALAIDFGTEWMAWWVSHGLGLTLIAPPVIALHTQKPRTEPFKPTRLIEGLILGASLMTASVYLFLLPQALIFSSVLRTYLVFPFLIWAALRFYPRYATILLAITGLMAVTGTTFNVGIFANQLIYLHDRIFTVQLYAGIMSFSTMLVIATLAERRRAAELLQENEQRLRTVFENSPDAIFILTLPVFHIAFLNRQNFMGYTSAELSQPDTLTSAVHPDDLELVMEYWRQLQSGASPQRIEYRLHRKNADFEWIQMRIYIMSRSASGAAFQVQVTLSDINERKQAERLSRSRLRLVEFSQSHSLDEQLQATLDEAESLTGSQVGFYHFLEDDQVTISLKTWSTRTLRNLCRAEGMETHYPVEQAGVWADCIRARRPVIQNDIASLPRRKGFPPGHADVKREMVVPVLRADKIVCILGLGNKPMEYTESDVELVAQLADFTWDITERKRAENALKLSESLLKETQSIAGVGGWQYEVSTAKVIWTGEVYTIYGVELDYNPSDIGRAMSWYAPEDQLTLNDAFQRVLATGQPYDLELGFINARGKRLWVRTSGKPVWDQGVIVKIIGTIADITDRKEAQVALAHNEELLRLAMEATSDGLWDWHCAENFTYYSPGYYRMLGYTPQEFPPAPQDWIELVHPDDREGVLKVDADCLENRISSFEIELRMRTKNGEWKWILSRGKCVSRGDNQRALRIVGTHVDITERKRSEQTVLLANRKLEKQALANQALQDLLIEQATHDALTGLYNRRYMDDALERELARARRESGPVCVMMLDIDHFKDFNDRHGHDVGDQVLMAFGRLLRASIRQSDIACRYGGEEFVIIMPGANDDDGQSRAEIIRREFERMTIGAENTKLNATISVGVALFPAHGASPDALLRAADSALYDSKNTGRNCVSLARK